MGIWTNTTKEMVRPQSVLGYPEPEDEPQAPAVSCGPVPARSAASWRTPADPAPRKARRDPARLPMDPRFRERWVSVRREEGHHRLRVTLMVAAVVAVLGGGVGVAFSPLLAVRHVRVAATPHVPVAQVLAVTGLGDQRPMVEVSSSDAVSRLDALPWVDSAKVVRQWPATVSVTVHERRPVAKVTGPGGVAEVDGSGRVLTQSAAPAAGLPTLVGAPAPGPPGTWLGGASRRSRPPHGLGASLTVASALPGPLAGRVGTITVDPQRTVTLTLVTGPTTVTLGEVGPPGDPAPGAAMTTSSVPVSLARQVAALSTLLTTVDLSHVAQIDLTVPDRPALTPAQTPTTVSTTSRG